MSKQKMCRNGLHDLDDPANVYTYPSTGRRLCRPCMLARQKAWSKAQNARARNVRRIVNGGRATDTSTYTTEEG